MISKRKLLAELLDYSKFLDLMKLINRKELIVMNYHRVYDEVLDTEFDRGVFGLSAQEFEKQIKWLKKNTHIISEEELISHIESGKPFSKRCVMITFDDGYIDNYELAYPILSSSKVPATFFIPTEAIEKRRVGWWDLISYFVRKTNKETININDKLMSVQSDQEKDAVIKELLRVMKTSKESKSFNLIETLSQQCELAFPTHEVQSSQLMSWDQIREVQANNISIGAHTHSHRVLSTITDEEQKNELEISKKILEDKLGVPVNSVSYPVGSSEFFTQNSKKSAREVGYKIAYSFNTGINRNRISDPFDIKRVCPAEDFSVFKAMVILPFFCL